MLTVAAQQSTQRPDVAKPTQTTVVAPVAADRHQQLADLTGPDRAKRFKDPVKVTERHVDLGAWDGTLSTLDRYLGTGETSTVYPFHQHVERVASDGDATVVEFCINKKALPVGGPVAPVLEAPTTRAGQPVTQGHGATLALFPSGIGMKNGGAAADGAPVLQLLRAIDAVITNPNTVHASAHNALDVESATGNPVMILPGTGHHEFLRGDYSLRPRAPGEFPDVTMITDNPINDADMLDHLYAQMVLKSNLLSGGVSSTDELGIDIGVDAHSGRAESKFADMYPLVYALGELKRRAKLQGVILTSFNFNDFLEQQYLLHLYGIHAPDGKPEANAMVNAEVSISYLVKAWTGLLSMHGPGTNYDFHGRAKVLRGEILADRQSFLDRGWAPELLDKIVASEPAQPNSAGEVISSKGIGCLLPSAQHTPVMIAPDAPFTLNQHNVLAVTVPSGCELSETTIEAAKSGIPVVVDLSNTTIQSPAEWVMSRPHISDSVIYCKTSVEMVGVVKMLKDGRTLEQIRSASFDERLEAGNSLFAKAGVNRKLFTKNGVLSYPKIEVREVVIPK